MLHGLNCTEMAGGSGSMHQTCRGRYFVGLLMSDFDIWVGRISMSVENTTDDQFELLFESTEDAHMLSDMYRPLSVCIDSHTMSSSCESSQLLFDRIPISNICHIGQADTTLLYQVVTGCAVIEEGNE